MVIKQRGVSWETFLIRVNVYLLWGLNSKYVRGRVAGWIEMHALGMDEDVASRQIV